MPLETGLRTVMQDTVELLEPGAATPDDRGNVNAGFGVVQTLEPSDVSVDPGGSGVRVERVGKHAEMVGDTPREVRVGDFTVICPPEADLTTDQRVRWVNDPTGRQRIIDIYALFPEQDLDGTVHHYEIYGREIGIP